MNLKKTLNKLYLWLGLSSGLVVFIVAVTGCIYAFQSEILDLTQSYRFVEPQNSPVLTPTQIWGKAGVALPNKHLHAVLYPTAERGAGDLFLFPRGVLLFCLCKSLYRECAQGEG